MTGTVYMCPCGCEMHIFRNAGILYFSSLLVNQEMIASVEGGFINGKHSALSEALDIIEQELAIL